jgi:hypothetical protein
MAFIACCGIACAIQSFFSEKRHRLLALPICRPDLRFNNTGLTTEGHWPSANQTWELRTNLDPAGLLRAWCFVISHSQQPQPRKPTGNSLFSQIHTRSMIRETTGILPCRGGG